MTVIGVADAHPLLVSFLLGALLIAIGCKENESPEKTVTSGQKTAHEGMVEDLHQYHDMVIAGWAYLKSKHETQGVDITGTRDRLLKRVTAETTQEEFAVLLQEFAAALEDGHSQVDTSSLKAPDRNTWPIGFGIVQEGIVVVNLNWLRDNPGIQLGDRLTHVDGEPIDELLRRSMEVTSASTDDSRRVLAVERMHRTENEQVHFTLEHGDGQLFDVELPCLDHQVDFRFRERKAFCTHSGLDHNIHLIRIPQFTWNESQFSKANTDSEREAALAEAKTQIDSVFSHLEKARGLILDLRGNSGGYELLSTYVAEHLVSGDFLYYSLTRHDSDFIRSLEVYRGYKADDFGMERPQHPRRWSGFRHFTGTSYSGPLIVLVDQRCFSTTDNLCAFLREVRPETQFVGQPTGGGTGEPLTVGTLNNSKVQVRFCVSMVHSPKGRLIEGTGTTPDVLVAPTREQLLERRDLALEAAIKQLTHASAAFDSWTPDVVAKLVGVSIARPSPVTPLNSYDFLIAL